MVYEAVGFDPAARTLAPSVKAYLDGLYAQGPFVPINPATTAGVLGNFNPGFSNFGSGYAPVGFRKIGTRVFLEGLINTANALPGGSNFVMFYLPAGAIPATTHLATLLAAVPEVVGRCDIDTAGAVRIVTVAASAGGYISVEGINFSTVA
jgi:hypothetical protein